MLSKLGSSVSRSAAVGPVESDPLSLWRECDWVAKYRLIEQVRERHNVPLSHPKTAMVDLMYHDVDRTRGLFYKLQARDQVDRTGSDADISVSNWSR